METRKIALACFFGGALCTAVALFFSPTYWWLGLLAGLAGGYLGYEFREVLQAVPVAWGRAGAVWEEYAPLVVEGVRKPHPFLYTALVIATPLWWWWFAAVAPPYGVPQGFLGWLTPLMIVAYVDFALPTVGVLFVLAVIGSDDASATARVFIVSSRYGRKVGYGEAWRWMGRGLVKTVVFLLWGGWIALGSGLARFAWRLFRLIHSQKRVLCALGGTLGGLIGYVVLVRPVMTPLEQMTLVLFGGILGAAFGVVDYEIVAKRLLHVSTAKA